MNVPELLARAGSRLGKGEAFTVLTGLALTYLLVVGLVNHEAVAAPLAAVAMAFIGGGAAKNYADQVAAAKKPDAP